MSEKGNYRRIRMKSCHVQNFDAFMEYMYVCARVCNVWHIHVEQRHVSRENAHPFLDTEEKKGVEGIRMSH